MCIQHTGNESKVGYNNQQTYNEKEEIHTTLWLRSLKLKKKCERPWHTLENMM
jgi:hypothetical protein